MNGVAIVICVNIIISCLYQIVPYMCSMYPLSVDNKKKKGFSGHLCIHVMLLGFGCFPSSVLLAGSSAFLSWPFSFLFCCCFLF